MAVRTQGALWAADASALDVCAVEIEFTLIHCVAGRPGDCTSLVRTRPFPAPHHTISDVEVIGAGISLCWGEVSLAHRGMLFPGELPEPRRHVLESACQPIEKHFTTIELRHMELAGKSGRILVRLICERPGPMQTRRPPAALHVRYGGEP